MDEINRGELSADHYFHIGQAHLVSGKPCQDYAISGLHMGAAYAVIADGCSTGGNTDVGARIIALSTAQAIREHHILMLASQGGVTMGAQEINERQKGVLSVTRKLLGLEQSDMLATCLYVYMTPRGGVINIRGDGVVALKYRTGDIKVFRMEWGNNMPFYPAYEESQLSSFIAAHGANNEPSLRLECNIYNPDGTLRKGYCRELSLDSGIAGNTLSIPEKEMDQLEFVAVFSDGVTQIDAVEWSKAVQSFMRFKNTTGEFAKRRMIRGIKDFQKMGKGPIDDIAYAVVYNNQIQLREDTTYG